MYTYFFSTQDDAIERCLLAKGADSTGQRFHCHNKIKTRWKLRAAPVVRSHLLALNVIVIGIEQLPHCWWKLGHFTLGSFRMNRNATSKIVDRQSDCFTKICWEGLRLRRAPFSRFAFASKRGVGAFVHRSHLDVVLEPLQTKCQERSRFP